MKITWLSLLRSIMTLIYFFTFISAVAAPFSFFLFSNSEKIPFESTNIKIYNVHWTFYVVLACAIIGYFFFLAMIFHLKKISFKISPSKFVDFDIQNHFYKSGIYCVIAALLTKIPAFIYHVILKTTYKDKVLIWDDLTINLGFSFDSVLVIVAFGIFLIIISKIINQSIKIQRENDLTI